MIRPGTGACALAAALLAACATPPAPATAQAQEQPRCERIYRVGTMLPTIQCEPGVSEAERQRLIDEWSRAAMPNHGQKATGGGG